MSALKPLRRPGSRTFAHLALVAAALVLTACGKEPQKSEDIRPVRAIVISASNVDIQSEFSGEVRSRIESRLGFRVPGKIIARQVEPGSVVKRGQVLMQLDPQDLRLSQAQARAGLSSAETTRDLARADLQRFQELRAKNFVSQAVLDEKLSRFRAAQANVEAAQAGYRGQSNQAGYATLVADIDGVVTAVEAEVGQVVQAGTPVVRLAKTSEKEIVIGLPEDKVDALRKVENVTVRMWANPGVSMRGKVREVSPVADPATRTYTARVSIPDASQEIRLGMTALVQFSSTLARPLIRVPLTALFHEKGATSVWVVEKGAVRLVPVTVGGTAGNEIVLAGGIAPGQTVVTAGVNLLKPGQKVKILPVERVADGGSAAK